LKLVIFAARSEKADSS